MYDIIDRHNETILTIMRLRKENERLKKENEHLKKILYIYLLALYCCLY